MKISLTLVSYNGMGGHPALSYVGTLLCGTEPPFFGGAVVQIEAYPRLVSATVIPGLESLKLRFEEKIKELPLAWLRRKTARVEITYLSRLGDASKLIEGRTRPIVLSDIQLVRAAYKELEEALKIIPSRFRASDEFNMTAFQEFIRNRVLALEETPDHDILKSIWAFQEIEQLQVSERQGITSGSTRRPIKPAAR